MKKLPHSHGTNIEKVLEKEPSQATFAEISANFALVSDSTRLKLLWLLCHCEECVINLAAAVDMSSPAVSHHLRILKQSKLIKSRKEGKEVYYSLANNEESALIHRIIDTVFEGH